MLAAMAEAHDASTGRASGLVVFWFSLGFTVSPPAFGWLLERTDAYGPGISVLLGLYVAAAVIMVMSRRSFAPLPHAANVEPH
jgi:MFS family permease